MTSDIKTIKNRLNRLKIGLNHIIGFLLILVIFSSFLPGCASIQQPTGGPKDSIPPKVLEETPPNLSRNFNAEEIEIKFDEYVKLRNEYTEFSISPDIESALELKIKKRSLIITLPDSLEENTTYSISFGKGLVDFNESNELVNYRYVFSTGDEIDSLTIAGTVTNAVTLEPVFDATVLLIPVKQDSIFGKRKANIFTRTDSSGNFRLQNLSENDYRIYALKEENNDRIYNSPNEEIGFLKDSIRLTGDVTGIKLTTFKEIPAEFRLLDRKIENTGRMVFVFNKPIEQPGLRIIDNSTLDAGKITEFTKNRDSALMWVPELTFDTIAVEISENNIPIDTTVLKRSKNDKYERALNLTDNLSNQRVDNIRNIIITSSAPIRSADLSKIKLVEDSVSRTNFQLTLDDEDQRRAYLKYRWRTKRSYLLTLEEGAFVGQFGETSKPGERKFTYDDTENYGDIILDIQLPDSNNYIVELIKDDKLTVADVKVINSSQKLTYRQFPGGNYSVRIIYDDNANNKWDTGNLLEKRQPEQLWYWNKIITIRPNWEQEEIVQVPTKAASAELPSKTLPTTQDEANEETNRQEGNDVTEEPYIKSGTVTPIKRSEPLD